MLIFFSDPNPPSILAVVHLSTSDAQVLWQAVPCNFGYPRGIRVSVYFPATRELAYEAEYNSTLYNNATNVGSTTVRSDRFVRGSYYYWVVRVLYNGEDDLVWSQPSPEFLSSETGVH